jgi:hypothetical protein
MFGRSWSGRRADLRQLRRWCCGNYIDVHNQNPKPFIWTTNAIVVLEKVTCAKATMINTRSA